MDGQQERLLNWIDELKLSTKSGSKLRDNLNLVELNLLNMRKTEADHEIDWDKISNNMRKRLEEDDYDQAVPELLEQSDIGNMGYQRRPGPREQKE